GGMRDLIQALLLDVGKLCRGHALLLMYRHVSTLLVYRPGVRESPRDVLADPAPDVPRSELRRSAGVPPYTSDQPTISGPLRRDYEYISVTAFRYRIINWSVETHA